VGCLTVDNTPIPMDSTPMDSLDLSHVIIRSISNRRFSIPIKVETVENTVLESPSLARASTQ
jgi:hypothetical protein